MDLDLGRLHLKSKLSGLHLQLASSARFTPSAEDDTEQLRARLTNLILNADSTTRPWIYRGECFELRLVLQFDHELEGLHHNVIIDKLATSLQNAQLWTQLCLSPASVESSNDSTHVITLALEYREPTQTKRKLHKLAVDVPFYDVKAPTGIESVALDVVEFDMSIGLRSGRKRQKICTSDSSPVNLCPTMDQNPVLEANLVPSDDDILDQCEADETEPISSTCSSLQTDEVKSSTEAVGFEDRHANADMLLHQDDEDSSYGSMPSSQSRSLLKRSSSMSDLAVDEDDSLIQRVIELVDAGIRHAISDSPNRIAKDIVVMRDSSLERLDEIAPALWSPGYLSTLSSRAVFLPTISHALGTICGRLSNSTQREDKIHRTVHQCVNIESHQTQQRDCFQSATVSSPKDTALWHLVQRSVYDPRAGQRLKPVFLSDAQCADAESEVEFLESTSFGIGNDADKDLGTFNGVEHKADPYILDEAMYKDSEFDDDSCENVESADYASIDRIDMFDTEAVLHRPNSLMAGLKGPCGRPNQATIMTCRTEPEEEEDLLSICESLSSVFAEEEEIEGESHKSMWTGREHECQEMLCI